MKISQPMAVFHCLAALLLALAGIGLLVAPHSFLALTHDQALTVAALPSRQAGMGLLLAAAVNIVCLAGGIARLPLHAAVLIYLAGLAALHATPVDRSALWLWLPVLLYALPLLPWHRLAPGRHRRGTVKWFNPNKGFGFIVAEDGDEVFVHFKAVRNGGRRSLRAGTRVRFTTCQSERGEQADQVHLER